MTDDIPRNDADGTDREPTDSEAEPTSGAEPDPEDVTDPDAGTDASVGEDAAPGDDREATSTGVDDGTGGEDETDGDETDGDETDGDESDGDSLRRYAERAVLGILFLFAVVAAFRFYFAASNAVSYWVAARYESAFQAAFNLVVLLVVGAGIVRQLRRMR